MATNLNFPEDHLILDFQLITMVNLILVKEWLMNGKQC